MNIYDFALKMERDGEVYYRSLAEKVVDDDLKTVLQGLADDEHRHYQIIKSLQQQDGQNVNINPSLDKVENVFTVGLGSGLQPKKKGLLIANLWAEQLDVYRTALEKENESVDLYRKLTDNAKSQTEKIICEKLRHEEEKHAEILDTIIEMLNHVHDWVEAAEFNHLDRY